MWRQPLSLPQDDEPCLVLHGTPGSSLVLVQAAITYKRHTLWCRGLQAEVGQLSGSLPLGLGQCVKMGILLSGLSTSGAICFRPLWLCGFPRVESLMRPAVTESTGAGDHKKVEVRWVGLLQEAQVESWF